MSKPISRRLFILIIFSIVFPLIANYWLEVKYTESETLIAEYECISQQCEGDFDGDGVNEKLIIHHSFFLKAGESKTQNVAAVIIENDKEVFRFPYNYIDDTFRTHIALYKNQGKTLLIIYDGTYKQAIPLGQVLVRDGGGFSQVAISGDARKILLAFKWHDDSGYWNIWSFYKLLSPWLFGLYILSLLTIFPLRYFWNKRGSRTVS